MITLETPTETVGGASLSFFRPQGPGPLPDPPSSSVIHLVGLANGPQRDPHGAHHSVPDETLVPHLHRQAQIQAIDLTVCTGGGDVRGVGRGEERFREVRALA